MKSLCEAEWVAMTTRANEGLLDKAALYRNHSLHVEKNPDRE